MKRKTLSPAVQKLINAKQWDKLVPKGEIDWLVMRLHVSASNRAVIKEFAKRMKSYQGPEFRQFRKECYRYAIDSHSKNQDLVSQFRL